MMGAGLVKAAYTVTDGLEIRDHAPVRLFVYMALTALDSDPQPRFYGGRDALAHALAAPRDATGYRSVKKAVRSLTTAGLIELESRPGRSRFAEYNLLDGAGHALRIADLSGVPNLELGTPERSVNNSDWGPLKGQLGTPEGSIGDPSEVPLGGEEELGGGGEPPTPPRTCRRHPSWDHDEPCRACGIDRRAAESQQSRPSSTMSPRVSDCGTGAHRRQPDGTCLLCENRDPLWDVA